ncbi:MAG: protein L [Betaproteobacteria bacterium]|nr:protein L [Betaproteobacteria bacterium]
MAFYKYPQVLVQNSHEAFDQIFHPGTPTPYSGIYRCEGCGVNEVSTHEHPLPPQNHHQHTPQQGAIRWRLAVATV